MCAVDSVDGCDVFTVRMRHAAKEHRCASCNRVIRKGERYEYATWLAESRWSGSRTCLHCVLAGCWLEGWCGGWVRGEVWLEEDLFEHWLDYATLGFGRILVGFRRKWRDGQDPLPTITPECFPEPEREPMRAQIQRAVEHAEKLRSA